VKERKAKNASLAWTQKYQKIEIKEKNIEIQILT